MINAGEDNTFFMRAKDINFSGEEVGKVKIVRLIGQGNWADVYLAEHVDTLEKFAVKTTSNKKFSEVPKLKELVQAEINILKSCKNPNVVKLVDSFLHKDHQFIVLEYCNGLQLGDVLGKEKKIDQPTAISYLKQILNGFKGLHEVRAMHRDFKVENVMLHDGACKIVDLGFGKQLMAEGEMAKTKLGSNLTMAPQVMQGLTYDFKVDIWSIGVVYYQMLYGTFPFQARSAKGLLQQTRRHQFSLQGQTISQDSKDFIRRCLKFNPEERINWTEIYHHRLIVDKNQEINFGPEISQINVQQNASFYEILQKSLKKSVAPPPQLALKQSSILSQLRQASSLHYPMFQSADVKRIEEMKYVPQLDLKQQRLEEENQVFSFGESKFFECQQEKKEDIREQKCIKSVRYLYQRKIQNIIFMANFVQNQMKQINNKLMIAKVLPILCLLYQQSYLQLAKFKEDLCFLKNTFKVDQKQFELFLEKDDTIPFTIAQHQKKMKQNFQTYMIFLQQENNQKYLEIRQKIQNCDNQLQKWTPFFNYFFKSCIDQLYCLINTKATKEDSNRLLKLSFSLSRYAKYNNQGVFERQILLSTLKKFDCQRAKKNLQMLVKQRQANRRKQQGFKKQEVKKNNSPTIGFFSSASKYICPFSEG